MIGRKERKNNVEIYLKKSYIVLTFERENDFFMGNIKSIAFNDKFEHDNIETFMVVWIDAEINKKIENQKAQEQIRAVNKNFKVFENGKQCEKFIRSISSKKEILLIINDIQGQELIPKIHNLQQITTIYIYKEIKQDNEQWINQFSKVSLLCSLYHD